MCRLSPEKREEIILEYMSYVRGMAYRIARNYNALDYLDDFRSSAYLGLVDAAIRYDTDFEVKFKTYMNRRVRGEVIDFFRRNKDRGLTGGLARKQKDVRVNSLDFVVPMPNGSKVIFQNLVNEEMGLYKKHSWHHAIQLKFIKRAISELIGSLPKKYRQCLILYYYSGLTMKDVGNLMGVTESRISQMVNNGLDRLAKKAKHKWGIQTVNDILPEV